MVDSLVEIHEGRQGDTQIDGEINKVRVFRAIMTDAQDEDKIVIAALASSTFAITNGTPHPTDTTCFAQRIRAENTSFSKRIWLITVNYSNKAIDNPTLKPAEFEWNVDKRTLPVIRDRFGNVITNTAGLPYDPPIEFDDEIDLIRVTKNVSAMPTWWPNGYKRTINSDPFTIDGLAVNIGKCRMVDRSLSGFKTQSGIPYRELKFTLAVKGDGWNPTVLNSGFWERNPAVPTEVIEVLIKGQPPNQPWPLDASGFHIENPTPSSILVSTHEIFVPIAYSTLPLT